MVKSLSWANYAKDIVLLSCVVLEIFPVHVDSVYIGAGCNQHFDRALSKVLLLWMLTS